MSILITGATGYIGSHLTKSFIDKGIPVRILCRSLPKQSFFKHPGIEIIKGDITDKDSIQRAMQQIDQVYHLAAYARIWAKRPETFHQINVEGTKNVLEAAFQSGVKSMVHTSTAGVLGPSSTSPIDETHIRKVPFFNAYEETKADAELLVQQYVQQGMNIKIVNPARVYGPGLDTGSNPVTKIIELYLKGRWRIIPGSGDDLGSYCYIDDVVDGHIAAMEKGQSGERYLFGGINVSFNEFIKRVKDISGDDRSLIHLPFSFLKMFSSGMLVWSKLTGLSPLITPDWIKRYDFHWALNSNKAVRELGYNIRPISEGLQNTITWLRANRI